MSDGARAGNATMIVATAIMTTCIYYCDVSIGGYIIYVMLSLLSLFRSLCVVRALNMYDVERTCVGILTNLSYIENVICWLCVCHERDRERYIYIHIYIYIYIYIKRGRERYGEREIEIDRDREI